VITLRPEQTKSLGRVKEQALLDRLARHVHRHFPERCQDLEERRLREIVGYSIARARDHGFEGEREICKYLNLVMVFGTRFDRSRSHPWAREALARGGSPALRMNALYRAGLRRAEGLL